MVKPSAVRHEILYQPSFAMARIMLDPGDSIRAESGAMVSMSPTITIQSGLAGGFGKVIGRLLGGESAFQTTFSASSGPGEVMLAPSMIGDIMPIELRDEVLMVSSGGYLAGDSSLVLDAKGSVRGFFAGEGLFMLRIAGSGTVLVSAFGAIHAVELFQGQQYIVDSGHVVAFSDGMGFQVRKAARTWIGALTSGEGLVAEFTGPGIVYMQSRSPQSFASFLGPFFPKGS